MADRLFFQIEFHKTRKHISISNKLTIEEKHEAIEKSILIIQSLVFFVASIRRIEINPDEFSSHLENVEEVIGSFCSVVLTENDALKKGLDENISQIPKL